MHALFVVRAWSERESDGDCRFIVEHVGTRVRLQLRSAPELVAFFERALREATDVAVASETERGSQN